MPIHKSIAEYDQELARAKDMLSSQPGSFFLVTVERKDEETAQLEISSSGNGTVGPDALVGAVNISLEQMIGEMKEWFEDEDE